MKECPGCGALWLEECPYCEGDGVDPNTGEDCYECCGDGETDCEQCEGIGEISDSTT